MFRTIIWFLYFWLYLIYLMPSLYRVKALARQNRIAEMDDLIHRTAVRWGRNLVRLTGSQVKVTGQENIPASGAVLFVSNHQSNLDIPLLLGYVDKPKAFIAKIELKKLPWISAWMTYMKCVFMDRQDVRQSLKAINQGVAYLKQGYSMVIFPEGTRSEDGALGEFKAGSLKLATKAGVPVIPVTIKGSHQIMKKKGFLLRPAQVEIIISPPIYVDQKGERDAGELAEKVRNIIAAHL